MTYPSEVFVEQKKFILIVEDEAAILRATARILKSRVPGLDGTRCEVLTYESPAQLMGDLEFSPDGKNRRVSTDEAYFLITDGNMPGMNGDTLIAALRSRLGDQLKFVVLASSDLDFSDIAKAMHVDFFIHGKVTQHQDDVVTLIENFLAQA